MRESDYRQALDDPATAFADPDAIARHASLSPEQKRELLARWHHHASRAGGEPPHGLLERLGRALEFVDTETGLRQQSHEQVLHGPGMAPEPPGPAGKRRG